MHEKKREWENSFILDLFDFRMHNFNDFSFNILTTSTPVSQIMRDQRNADDRTLYYKPHITKRFSVRSNAAQKRVTRNFGCDIVLIPSWEQKLRVKCFRDLFEKRNRIYRYMLILSTLFGEPDDFWHVTLSWTVELSLWNEEGNCLIVYRGCSRLHASHYCE